MSQALVPSNQTEVVEIWTQLSPLRKIGLIALAIAALVGIIFFFTWAQTPDYAVAYTNLNAKDAAAVVTYLNENNISYQVSADESIISVPKDQVHDVRLALAAQGIPGSGTVGMELFDNANLGMTDFMQQVNYQRALEGELSRTISNITNVASARVHIVIPQPTLFSEEEQPTTASVVVNLEAGQTLNKEQVQAISHLVSSAVEGLSPENITIIDQNGRVLSTGAGQGGTASVALTTTQLEAQRSYEQDLELRIQTMLRNVLGPDKAVVRVSSEMNWDMVETESETFTPGQGDGTLRSSREITEFVASSSDSTGGVPGTTSNIPDTAASFQTGITGTTSGDYLRSDITRNFEVSRSLSKVVPATGQVEKLSVSVVVDGITDTVTLGAIEQATIAAAGIDQTRGDVLNISSIAFDRTVEQEMLVEAAVIETRAFYLNIAQWVAVAIALVALFFVVRSIQRSMRPPQPSIVVEGEEKVIRDPREALLDQVSKAGGLEGLDLEQIGPPAFSDEARAAAEKAQMVRQLQLMSKNKSETLAQIIQFWITEDSGKR